MRELVRRAWHENRWLTLGFLLALVLFLALILRVSLAWVYFETNRDAEVAPWMTIGYVARSHRVDRREMFDALEGPLGLTRGDPESIDAIAERTGLTEAEVIARIEATLAQLKTADGR